MLKIFTGDRVNEGHDQPHIHKGGCVVGDQAGAALVRVREGGLIRNRSDVVAVQQTTLSRSVLSALLVLEVRGDGGGSHDRGVETVGAQCDDHQAGHDDEVEQLHEQLQTKERVRTSFPVLPRRRRQPVLGPANQEGQTDAAPQQLEHRQRDLG